MAKFITGKELEDAIYDIIWDAEQTLLIVSPYIKLDNYFKQIFEKHINNPKLHIIIIFGKNEEDVQKSLNKHDFDFFKNFLNISIIYTPNLHAKYYGNETKGVITSINLHDYSFKNNIEFGVFSEYSIINSFGSNTDKDAWNKCFEVAEENEAVFIKRPVYEKKLLSIITGKNFVKSDILHDVTDKFYTKYNYNKNSKDIKKLKDFEDELELGSQPTARPNREDIQKVREQKAVQEEMGYCIRTGERIPFNPKMPYTISAYNIWKQFRNYNYPENYCHKTGRNSNGQTNFNNPIL